MHIVWFQRFASAGLDFSLAFRLANEFDGAMEQSVNATMMFAIGGLIARGNRPASVCLQ
jgi:hypothetical protein